jgi:lipopolysaccharide export system protein LptC
MCLHIYRIVEYDETSFNYNGKQNFCFLYEISSTLKHFTPDSSISLCFPLIAFFSEIHVFYALKWHFWDGNVDKGDISIIVDSVNEKYV